MSNFGKIFYFGELLLYSSKLNRILHFKEKYVILFLGRRLSGCGVLARSAGLLVVLMQQTAFYFIAFMLGFAVFKRGKERKRGFCPILRKNSVQITFLSEFLGYFNAFDIDIAAKYRV